VWLKVQGSQNRVRFQVVAHQANHSLRAIEYGPGIAVAICGWRSFGAIGQETTTAGPGTKRLPESSFPEISAHFCLAAAHAYFIQFQVADVRIISSGIVMAPKLMACLQPNYNILVLAERRVEIEPR
jgi:hypothetical protein